jgi:2-phosphosulfolactate phosphatase
LPFETAAVTRPLFVHQLPALCEPRALAGGVAVVVDVLRASTTISRALAAGATAVLPVAEIDEARQRSATFEPGTVLLGGERGGERIPGFDLGNSPDDYTPAVVAGRTLVFTTTNGTLALLHARRADRVLVGCFANQRAVVEAVLPGDAPLHVVCAGTNGEVTLEDLLFAGSLASTLFAERTARFEPANDSAAIAVALHDRLVDTGRSDPIHRALRDSRGGRNLIRLGLDTDIATAARIDSTHVLPVFDPLSGTITVAHPGV